MNLFTQTVLVVGRLTPSGVQMLGTGFLISRDGQIVTAKHVINGDERNLVVLMPKINNINLYQDTSDTTCQPISVSIAEIDPFRDISILKADISLNGLKLPELGSFDDVSVGGLLTLFGFPHCVEGRKVLTCQHAELGAKVLLECNSIKSKHGVVNIQARPGQSGSIIYAPSINKIVGMLIGAFAPTGDSISLGGINPRELHQTTHCLSAEYIRKMLEE